MTQAPVGVSVCDNACVRVRVSECVCQDNLREAKRTQAPMGDSACVSACVSVCQDKLREAKRTQAPVGVSACVSVCVCQCVCQDMGSSACVRTS